MVANGGGSVNTYFDELQAAYGPNALGPELPIKESPTTPLQFGAVGDGVTLDDVALQAWIADLATSIGGHGYLPPRFMFRTSQPLTVPDGVHIEGPGAAQISIYNTASDVFSLSATASRVHLHDFGVRSGAGGGHIFNFGAFGLSLSRLQHLYLQQDNAAKSVLTTAFWVDNTFSDSSMFGAPARSVPIIQGISTTDNLSDNTFRNLRLTDQGLLASTWQIWWEEASASQCIGTVFEEITFENPIGGAITVRGQFGYKLSGLYLWDLAGTAIADLVAPRASVGHQANRAGVIERVTLPSGSTGAFMMIGFGSVGSESGTLIRQCPATGSATVRIDMQHNLGCRIESCPGVTGFQSLTPILTVQTGAGVSATATVPIGGVYANTVSLTTGASGVASGNLIAVTANANGWMLSAPLGVKVFPMNAAAAALGTLYATSSTATGFTIGCTVAPAASTLHLIGYEVTPALAG